MSAGNLHPEVESNEKKCYKLQVSVNDCFFLAFAPVGVFTEATIKIPALVSLN